MVYRFPVICAALLSPQVRRGDTDLCTLSDKDVSNAEDVVKALKPLDRCYYSHVRGEHPNSVFDCSTAWSTHPGHKGQHRRVIIGPGGKAGH